MQRIWFLALAGLIVAGTGLAARAQEGLADGLSGFSQSGNEPISIEADTLEVRDGEKQAIFSGNVFVVQGEVTLRTTRLKVVYSGSAQGPGDQDIERLEATGKVVVTSGDQTATGDSGVFDASKDLITLTGNVVLSQGESVLEGKSLIVDLKTGTSRMIADGSGSSTRVRALITPKREAPQ